MDDEIWRPQSELNRSKGRIFDALKILPRLQCMYPQPSGCTERVIDSHTVQKSAVLELLADSSRHVIMFEYKLFLDDPPIERPPYAMPRRVGINEATIFRGLCAKHDNAVFSPIEDQPIDPDCAEHPFLAAYRSILEKAHRERVDRARMGAVAQWIRDDDGASADSTVIAALAASLCVADEELSMRVKRHLDQCYLTRSFEVGMIHMSKVYPNQSFFALSAAATPSLDFSGRQATILQPNRDPDWVSFTVLPQDESTIFLATVPEHAPLAVVDMFSELVQATGEEFELRLSKLALANVERIVIAPDFWDALSESRKNAIVEYFNSTTEDGTSAFPGPAANLFRV